MATFTASSNGIYAKLVVTEQSQSVANNTTTLLWEIYMWNTTAKPNWYMYDQHNIFQVKINGEYVLNNSDFGRVSLQYEQSESAARLITSGTYTIAHNSDGTKTGVPVYLYAAQGWEYAYVWETSGTMNLTTIARASQPSLSASSITLGSAVTIYTNRASSSFTHTLEYSIGSASGTIASGVGTSQSWTPSKELARQFPNATSGVVTITCKTYNGSTLIGTKPTFLTINISSDMIPSVSATISEAASIPSGISGYIKTRSKLKIVASASGSYGSTIMSYKITANGATYNASEATTGYLTTDGSNAITVTVTDSRGQPKTYSTTVTVLDYSPPRIDSLNAYRCNSSGTADAEGAYLKIEFTGTITSLNSKNSRTAYVQTRPSGGSWSTQGYTLGSGYSGFTGYTAVLSAATTTSYEVRVQVADSFSTSSFYTTTVSTASILMNILSDKSGMAIGKMAEKAKTVQLGWDLELKGDPTEDNHAANKKYVDTKQTLCKATIDLRGYDEGIWYPVDTFIENLGLLKIHVHSRLYDGDIPSWCLHSSGFYADFVMLVEHNGWGESNCRGICLHHDYKFADTNPIGYTQLSNSSRAVLYLRGGGIYYVDTDWNCEWAIRTSDLTVSDQTASLKTSYPGVTGYVNANIYANLVGNVTGDLNGTAAKANRIRPTSGETYGTGNRLSSANIPPKNDSSLYTFLATSSMTEGKPNGDGNIIHMEWDNTGYSTQIFVPHSPGKPMQFRAMYKAKWPSGWTTLLDDAYVTDYPVAQATSGYGIWSFIKFNSGIAMCWGEVGKTAINFQAWNSVYDCDPALPSQALPFTFAAVPHVYADALYPGDGSATAGIWLYNSSDGSTTHTPSFGAVRPNNPGRTIYKKFQLFVIGRWK